ncbi:MAG TPA: aspartate aminotransferase family protein [Symbiobacteriaceae bacterium]|nr:aspartate aminotransferase family protein [Symbiobacteriaceae bacterium]
MNLHERGQRHLLFAESRPGQPRRPVIMSRGEGSTIWDTEGREYLDAQAGLVVTNIGYGRRELAQVAARQMDELMYYHTYFHFANEPAVELAAKLAELAPPGLEKVVYTLGGAESVETSVKLARLYQRAKGRPQGDKIICLQNAYHGNTMGALSATGFAAHKEYFGPLVPGFSHITPPDPWLYPDRTAAQFAAELEQVILAEGPETCAAFLAEPIMGVAGMVVPVDGYWQAVRAICDRYGILWIADEVMTGFGRAGAQWGLDHWGVDPDVICTAKGLTSGYLPMGAVIIRDSIVEAIAAADLPFTHGFTYAGHPVACAVALKNIEIYEAEGLAGHAAAMGERLIAGLKATGNPYFGEVRGRGLMVGVELVRAGREPFACEPGFGFRVEAGCFAAGVIIGVAPYRDALMLTPPLVITPDEIDRLVAVVDRIVREEAERLA